MSFKEDPSLEAKNDLTELGVGCVKDLGVASRLIIRNSANLNKTCKEFVATDDVVTSTNATLMKLARTMASLNEQTYRIQQCFDEIPKIAEALDECHKIAERKTVLILPPSTDQYTATSLEYSRDSDTAETV